MSIATQDIRQRAIAAYESGSSTVSHIAKLFQVHRSTLHRWIQRYKTTGQTVPLPRGHNPPALNVEDMQKLEKMLQANSDMTLSKMRDALGKSCSLTAIHFATLRLDWRYKKSRYERVSKTEPT
jgi:transposase